MYVYTCTYINCTDKLEKIAKFQSQQRFSRLVGMVGLQVRICSMLWQLSTLSGSVGPTQLNMVRQLDKWVCDSHMIILSHTIHSCTWDNENYKERHTYVHVCRRRQRQRERQKERQTDRQTDSQRENQKQVLWPSLHYAVPEWHPTQNTYVCTYVRSIMVQEQRKLRQKQRELAEQSPYLSLQSH